MLPRASLGGAVRGVDEATKSAQSERPAGATRLSAGTL